MSMRFVILCVCMFFISVLSVFSFYSVDPVCPTGVCVSGETVFWNVTIENRGYSRSEYAQIEIVDTKRNVAIALFDPDFFPLQDEQGDLLLVLPQKKRSIVIEGIMPSGDRENMFYYYPCFSIAVTDGNFIYRTQEIYEIRQCYPNESVRVRACTADSHCSTNKYCVHGNCVALVCEDCQYERNHICNDYECCSSDSCVDSAACIDNVCFSLECAENEFVFNHSCVSLGCAPDEIGRNHSCVSLECLESEGFVDHSCVVLDCAENEVVFNHSCVSLECDDNEFAQEHSCASLSCAYNERIVDNTCVPLNCWFFERIEDHECVARKEQIKDVSFESIAVFAIIIFLIIDFRKFRGHTKHSK